MIRALKLLAVAEGFFAEIENRPAGAGLCMLRAGLAKDEEGVPKRKLGVSPHFLGACMVCFGELMVSEYKDGISECEGFDSSGSMKIGCDYF